MNFYFLFFVNSALLGVGLAMDAFSVSMANGLKDPGMSAGRMCITAGTFGLFQYAMPVLGWFFVRVAADKFEVFQRFIPWIALGLLGYIGGEMLLEGIKNLDHCELVPEVPELSVKTLFMQGIATSIDALSVGFTISGYNSIQANGAGAIIGIVTFFICLAGLQIGKIFGTRLACRASILGGVILIGIGLEIFIGNIFF